MRWAAVILLAATPALAETVPVPSGQPVDFVEVIKNAPGSADVTWRFRFLAPEISREGGSVGIDTAISDIESLCNGFVMMQLTLAGEQPELVVISMSDRPVEFGTASPEATQFFEAFRIKNQNCIWEGF